MFLKEIIKHFIKDFWIFFCRLMLSELIEKFSSHIFYLRKNKPLLMLQSINRLQELDKTDQRVVTKVTDFYNYVSKNKPFLSETVLSVIKEMNA